MVESDQSINPPSPARMARGKELRPPVREHQEEVSITMSSVMSPASADEALDMLQAAMGYLAAADPTAMAAEEQARCLRVLERATSVGTAARTSVLGAFPPPRAIRGRGLQPAGLADPQDRGDQGAAAWPTPRGSGGPRTPAGLRRAGRRGPVRVGRPGRLPVDQPLPEDCRHAADDNPLSRRPRRDDLRDLAGLFGEIYEQARVRTCPMRTRTGPSMTGRCGWSPRSRAPGCCTGT